MKKPVLFVRPDTVFNIGIAGDREDYFGVTHIQRTGCSQISVSNNPDIILRLSNRRRGVSWAMEVAGEGVVGVTSPSMVLVRLVQLLLAATAIKRAEAGIGVGY